METTNTNTSAATLTPIIGKTVKINKYALLGLNAFMMLPFLIRQFTIAGLIVYLAVCALEFLVVFKSVDTVPATADIPIMIFADVLIYIGLYHAELAASFRTDLFPYFFQAPGALFLITLALGISLGLVALAGKKTKWLAGISGWMIGFSFILLGWSNCDILYLQFYNFGGALAILFTLACVAWTIVLQVIRLTAPEKVKSTIWVGVILLVVFLMSLLFETEYVFDRLAFWHEELIDIANTGLAWWQVLLCSVILLGCAFTLYLCDGSKGMHLTVDTYLLILCFELLFTAKLLTTFYFSHNWMILPALVIGTIKCMKNDYSGRETMRLSSLGYLIAQYGAALLLILLFRKGLWINVIITVLFFLLFYTELKKRRGANEHQVRWVLIPLCIVGETAAWAWRYFRAVDMMVLLAVILFAGVVTLLIINRKQPGDRRIAKAPSVVVCVCVAVLCLVASLRPHAQINTDVSDQTVNVQIEPPSEDVQIEEAHYMWRDRFGLSQSEDTAIRKSGSNVTIQNEILMITATDDRGVVTSKIVWYPYWLRSLMQ